MAIAAIIYISISVLLIISTGMLFVKTVQFLIKKQQPIANHQRDEQDLFLRPDPNDPLAISTQRADIIAMLERQFASSPSSDS